jgi:hypothetical protein
MSFQIDSDKSNPYPNTRLLRPNGLAITWAGSTTGDKQGLNNCHDNANHSMAKFV